MYLQYLFHEPIQYITKLTPSYEDQASDVSFVQTKRQAVVVRITRMVDEQSNDFGWKCKRIFGIDPRNVFSLERINNTLNNLTS
ncbi:hypothetical protein JUJ52_06170 [Virgibacillus sp. AGTR]|uniref:Uncharacterized protein n=1 Tax=Virgibacillus salarius TaxID=447199 RepID=A0A941DUW5_9BACI|nr:MULTISPECIES: hypothetical protein [Bacillaceae]MBR7794698.1 hypothetical protein [Virgibacillus salarius]MCC2249552.1 hypothetical protein [Virgibacillus sp. AGTR]NAZ07418.1 hypothetical protein [Agaribacter marinus]